MIKEEKKRSKYNIVKTKNQIILEYVKTIFCSFVVATILTSFLAIHARNEMIKDITVQQEQQSSIDRKMAIDIIQQTDLLKDLKNKTYSVCMHAGEICETAGDFIDAQMAYELAIQKNKNKTKTYKPYYKLICVLVAQQKFSDAESVLNNIEDKTNKDLIKFKTRSYITIGDKYYSIGKFLSAAKAYENANFYYNKFDKKDSVVEKSIVNRIVSSYIQAADIMVQSNLNKDALRFLQKAEKYLPKDFNIRYKIAILLADLDPENSAQYFEKLLEEKPQNIDYEVYTTALMKSANIADAEGRTTEAKYYRYKIRSIDLFVSRKVVYKNDIEISLKTFKPKKFLFKYPINLTYSFLNISNTDLINLKADFILATNDKEIETVSTTIANKNKPLLMNSIEPTYYDVSFKKKVFTKKDLESYKVIIYLYKDEKYKTLIGESRVISK